MRKKDESKGIFRLKKGGIELQRRNSVPSKSICLSLDELVHARADAKGSRIIAVVLHERQKAWLCGASIHSDENPILENWPSTSSSKIDLYISRFIALSCQHLLNPAAHPQSLPS